MLLIPLINGLTWLQFLLLPLVYLMDQIIYFLVYRFELCSNLVMFD